jgi:hypothetical protein
VHHRSVAPVSEQPKTIRRAVADLLELAKQHPTRLPIFRDPRAKVSADRLFVHIKNEQEQARRGPGSPTVVAVVTSLDMSIFHPQIQFAGGLYVSCYQGDLFINQLSQICNGFCSPYEWFAREQLWMQWSARSGRHRIRRSGASLALLEKIFDGNDEIDIHRVGHPTEPRLFEALTIPAKRARATRTLMQHLDPTTFDNPTFYGPGHIHGYYFTSDPVRVRYHLKKTGASLYQARVERSAMRRLVRQAKLFVALEWVDEINFFSIEALTYLGGRCREVNASSRPAPLRPAPSQPAPSRPAPSRPAPPRSP